MEKKIAIPTHEGKLSKGISINTTFNIFDLEEDNVVKVEQVQIKHATANYISLWLKTKRVTDLYIEEISSELKSKLNQFGIIVKEKDELSNNKFFNKFVFL